MRVLRKSIFTAILYLRYKRRTFMWNENQYFENSNSLYVNIEHTYILFLILKGREASTKLLNALKINH